MQRALVTLGETQDLAGWRISAVNFQGDRAEVRAEHAQFPPLTLDIRQSSSADLPPLSFKIIEGRDNPEAQLQAFSEALSAVLRDEKAGP